MKDFFRLYVFCGLAAFFATAFGLALIFPELPGLVRGFITMAVFAIVVFAVKYLEERKRSS